jgi:outer membrane lipoprotein-sorting protein
MFKYLQNLRALYLITLLFLYSSSVHSSEMKEDIKNLENYLNSIKNISFIFEQYIKNEKTEIGWMQIEKPNKLRIEYKGANDLIIIANNYYLILYKANDDIITSLSNDGPWDVLINNDIKITEDIKNAMANGYVSAIKKISHNGVNHIFYDLLMKNEDDKFIYPIILHASTNPFKLNGWQIYNDKNEAVIIKIKNILKLNEQKLSLDIFTLSKKNRLEGKVWKGPFNKSPIIRKPTNRY